MSEPFRISPGEALSPVWTQLKTHLEARLTELRQQNDSSSLDPVATEKLRGRIAEVKRILSLDTPLTALDQET